MKMGAIQYKSNMSKCDACGGPIREMKMIEARQLPAVLLPFSL